MLLVSDSFFNNWNIIAPIGWKILEVLLIFFVGRKLIKVCEKLIIRTTGKAEIDPGVGSFIASFTKIILYVILLVAIAGIFGVPTASFITIIGSCGLAVGLALQGSLQNFAGGVLILVMKPFVTGDYIIVNGLEGTATSIDICYTKLTTVDNKVVILPNGTLSNSNLINVSKEKFRRIDITVPVSYSDDIRGVKQMLEEIAENNTRVLKDRQVDVFVNEFDNSSIQMGFRTWVKSSDYWPVKWELMETIKLTMDERGYTVPFSQMDVFIKNQK